MIQEHTSETMKAVYPAVSSKTYRNNGRTVVSFMGGNQSNNGYSRATIPINVLEAKDENGSTSVVSSFTDRDYDSAFSETKTVWGSANMTVPGLDVEIFASAHSENISEGFIINLVFKRLSSDGTSLYTVAQYDHTRGNAYKLYNATIAAGDFDNNGYKDELVLAMTNDYGTYVYIYKLSYNGSGNSVSVTPIFDYRATHNDKRDLPFGTDVWKQTIGNAVVGDFDGDGQQELCIINKMLLHYADFYRTYNYCRQRAVILKYNIQEKYWRYESGLSTGPEFRHDEFSHPYGGVDNLYAEGPIKAVRADVDGDGKDEIVILRFPIDGSDVCFDIDYIWCDPGSLTMHQDYGKYHLGGKGNNDLLGTKLSGNYLNQCQYFNECISLTAGPLTGRVGKGKVADDIAISLVDSRRQIWIVKTKADSNGNFTGFEKGKKIYDEPVSVSGKYARGALLTADFAQEGLLLGTPEHQVRNHTTNYVGVFEAFPYHVDNLTENGTALRDDNKPTNFTFSGFKGYEGDGEMSFKYVKKTGSSENQSVMFGTSGVKETIFALGNDDASTGVLTYLKARKTMSNAIGEFFPPAKAAGSIYGMIQDFVTDKVQSVKKETNTNQFKKEFESSLETYERDAIYRYEAPQYIWRYPILNAVMPSWWTDGARISYESADKTDVKEKEYITFSLIDL